MAEMSAIALVLPPIRIGFSQTMRPMASCPGMKSLLGAGKGAHPSRGAVGTHCR